MAKICVPANQIIIYRLTNKVWQYEKMLISCAENF